ncbi:MAG: hypothetical protein D6765_06735 [Bacteroidetes bacterium]|nr:MAG: hypothetical protein D6765_06735 [Bacteroidota bacterium]
MSKEQIQSLRIPFDAVLPHGAINEIANRTGLTPQTIAKVLRGEWSNPQVIREALKLIRQHRRRIENFLNQFQ